MVTHDTVDGRMIRRTAGQRTITSEKPTKETLMQDEMLNKTKPYNKSSGLQGIGDTVDAMEEYDMNKANNSIGPNQSGKMKTSSLNKNS
jgi:hypothetical protein